MRLSSSIAAILVFGSFLNAQEPTNQQVLIGRLSALAPLSAAHVAEFENRVRVNAGHEAARTRLLQEFGLEIGAGLGALAGKVWRIGLMGHSSRPANVALCLSALETVIKG